MYRRFTIRVVLLAIVGFAATAALSASSDAYVEEGCYWPTIQNNGQFAWYNEAAGDGASAFASAATAWSNIATKIHLYQNNSPSDGIIADNPALGDTGDDGITYYECTSGTFDAPVYSYLNATYTASYSAGERQSVAAHELGHSAAGLAPYNAGCAAVEELYTSVRWGQCGVDQPQGDDRNGTDAVYGSP